MFSCSILLAPCKHIQQTQIYPALIHVEYVFGINVTGNDKFLFLLSFPNFIIKLNHLVGVYISPFTLLMLLPPSTYKMTQKLGLNCT